MSEPIQSRRIPPPTPNPTTHRAPDTKLPARQILARGRPHAQADFPQQRPGVCVHGVEDAARVADECDVVERPLDAQLGHHDDLAAKSTEPRVCTCASNEQHALERN